MNIQQTVKIFHNKRKPDHRYASFDYCYNYFSQQSKDDILSDMEKSCLVLGFYLASWGMLRGSSFLLGHSLKKYEPLVCYIAEQKESEINPWNIDVDSYTDSHIDYLLKQYKDIEYAIMGDEEHESLTLVTKIMLGVFGHTPAVDTYFKKTFSELFGKRCGFTVFNKEMLVCMKEFYDDNKKVIDGISTQLKTIDVTSGKETNICYPKAKIIDMYGFQQNYPR